MANAFYRVIGDVRVPNRWYLASPKDDAGNQIDLWAFTSAQRYLGLSSSITIPVYRQGLPLDYTENAFGTPILSDRAVPVFQELGGDAVQLLPVTIPGLRSPYWILNVVESRGCVDETLSNFEKVPEDDPVRPDRAGQYRIITKLVINGGDPTLPQVFRIQGSLRDLVVGEMIKQEVQRKGLTGIRFWEAYPNAVSMEEFAP